MVNITTGQEESVDLNFLGTEGSNITDVEMDTINMMRYIKDKYNISGGAYHEMTQNCKSMPRHHKIKDCIGELKKIGIYSLHPMGHVASSSLLKKGFSFACSIWYVCI